VLGEIAADRTPISPYSAAIMQPRQNLPTIGEPTSSELVETLALVFARLETDAQRVHIGAAIDEIQSARGNHILLCARREQRIVASAWLQMQPGGVGSLWPPGLAADESKATAATLIDLALSKAGAAGAIFVQALLEIDTGIEADLLKQADFKHVTDLLYLVSQPHAFPTNSPDCDLTFESIGVNIRAASIDQTQWLRLRNIIEQTYQGTLDCPAVQGVRSIDDVLASYQAVGEFDPSRWFIVQNAQSNADVGCLLLTMHSQQRNCELVYMGIVPAARGKGYGLEVIRRAQWLCGLGDAERLVLAVDAMNAPAIRAYAAAGFETWDRRSVFLLTDFSR
jgi:mycothiol synthase